MVSEVGWQVFTFNPQLLLISSNRMSGCDGKDSGSVSPRFGSQHRGQQTVGFHTTLLHGRKGGGGSLVNKHQPGPPGPKGDIRPQGIPGN